MRSRSSTWPSVEELRLVDQQAADVRRRARACTRSRSTRELRVDVVVGRDQ